MDTPFSARPCLAEKSISRTVLCNNASWISELPEKKKAYTAQIRYHGEFLICKIEIQENQKTQIIFNKSVLVDKGQSIVIYDGDNCLGGGVVV